MSCCIAAHAPHAPCAICNDDYLTRYVCDGCRNDPANATWVERSRREVLRGEPEADFPEDREDAQSAREHIAALHDRRLRPVPERTRQILQLVALYQIKAYVRPRGKARASREWIEQRRPLTLAEIGFLVGVSSDDVYRILCRYEPLMRAVARRRRSRLG